jgi:hypothetical protein
MTYTDAAELLLHRLSLQCDIERMEQIQEIAELLAETRDRTMVTKHLVESAAMAAGIEFVEVEHVGSV